MAEAETHARACRKLCVAAVQMASVLGEVETNLQVAIARVIDCVLPCCRSLTVPGAVASVQAAERWIAAAAARGAELVLLPDCFACGYCLSSAAWKFAGVSWAQHRKRAGRGSEQPRRQLVCSARRTRLWALNARFRWSAASTMPVRWRLRALRNNTTSFPPRTQGACSAYLPICLSIRLSIPLSEQLLPCMPTSLSLLAGPLVRAGKHSRT